MIVDSNGIKTIMNINLENGAHPHFEFSITSATPATMSEEELETSLCEAVQHVMKAYRLCKEKRHCERYGALYNAIVHDFVAAGLLPRGKD